MAIIRNFRDLEVYQQSREQAQRISSRAVKSMIAEAHRRYPASFVSKMTDALGEATETQSWLDDALDCGYITTAQHRKHDAIWQSLGGMINNTIERSADFCRVASK